MAISSYNAKLMKGTGTSVSTATSWTQVIPIKKTPQLGGEPELLETTSLDDSMKTFITGIQNAEAMQFTANYTKTDYETLKALEGESKPYAIFFGNDGSGADGKYGFMGQLSVYINEAEVNAVVEMTISIAPNTPVTKITN